ncbi:MAG TPA: DUF2922 domain-containing protein [Clostridia bacterium]|nr:DUF2922 domain-containing protein [Clostridia bacterium]
MSTARLEMSFRNAEGRRVTLSVLNPREDLSTQEVRDAMEAIVAHNVFTSNGGDLVEVIGARLVSREVVELF